MATTTGSTPDCKMQVSDCADAPDNAQAIEIHVAVRKPGRPSKSAPSLHSSSSWQASDPQPKRGRPRIRRLQNTLGPEGRHRRTGSAAGAMTARNAMRAARPTSRQARALSDPYKVLRLHRCETDTSLIRTAYAAAQMSCSDMLPFPAQLGEDPDSAGHRRLMMLSDANMILEDRRMKTLLDKCLNHHYKKHPGSAVDILDIIVSPVHARPTEQDVEQAYNARMAEWSGLETVAEIVVKMLRAARETVLRDLRHAQEEEERFSHRKDRRDSFMEDADGLENDDEE